jgi:hypothetical protein
MSDTAEITEALPEYAELETDTRGVNGYVLIEPDSEHHIRYTLTASDNEASVTIPLTIDEVRELHLKLTAMLLAEHEA